MADPPPGHAGSSAPPAAGASVPVASPPAPERALAPVRDPDRIVAPAAVAVELFGVPRLLLGAPTADAAGATLGDLAADLAARCPALAGPVLDPATGWLRPGYQFVVDGRFTRDPATPLAAGAEVLLVSSVAGGSR